MSLSFDSLPLWNEPQEYYDSDSRESLYFPDVDYGYETPDIYYTRNDPSHIDYNYGNGNSPYNEQSYSFSPLTAEMSDPPPALSDCGSDMNLLDSQYPQKQSIINSCSGIDYSFLSRPFDHSNSTNSSNCIGTITSVNDNSCVPSHFADYHAPAISLPSHYPYNNYYVSTNNTSSGFSSSLSVESCNKSDYHFNDVKSYDPVLLNRSFVVNRNRRSRKPSKDDPRKHRGPNFPKRLKDIIIKQFIHKKKQNPEKQIKDIAVEIEEFIYNNYPRFVPIILESKVTTFLYNNSKHIKHYL